MFLDLFKNVVAYLSEGAEIFTTGGPASKY
jgi:hypothetical protein